MAAGSRSLLHQQPRLETRKGRILQFFRLHHRWCKWQSAFYLRQEVEVVDRCGDTETRVGRIFYAEDRRLTTSPALCSSGQFGRQDQDNFDLRAWTKRFFRVKKHPVGAQVASCGCLLAAAVPSSQGDRHAHLNARGFSALASVLFHGRKDYHEGDKKAG